MSVPSVHTGALIHVQQRKVLMLEKGLGQGRGEHIVAAISQQSLAVPWSKELGAWCRGCCLLG